MNKEIKKLGLEIAKELEKNFHPYAKVEITVEGVKIVEDLCFEPSGADSVKIDTKVSENKNGKPMFYDEYLASKEDNAKLLQLLSEIARGNFQCDIDSRKLAIKLFNQFLYLDK